MLEPAEVRIRVMSVRLGAAATFAIAVLYWLDGGGRSAIAYGLLLALAFAAFQYPLRGAAAVAALVVGGYMAAALARPHVLAEVGFVAAALACTSVMSVWTAWWRHRSATSSPASRVRTR